MITYWMAMHACTTGYVQARVAGSRRFYRQGTLRELSALRLCLRGTRKVSGHMIIDPTGSIQLGRADENAAHEKLLSECDKVSPISSAVPLTSPHPSLWP